MTQESWPSREPAEPRSPLPRVEDLPVAADGYDRESVREAFDAFYRHLARLDTTLRAIEAVDVFRDQAGELRKELRALRTAGWTQQQQQQWTRPYGERGPLRPTIAPSVVRLAFEAALIIAVAVVVGVASFSALVIGASIGGAFLIVVLVEILAARERPLPTAPARTVAPPPLEAPEPAPAPAPAVDEAAWTARPPETEEEFEEELTAVAAAAEAAEERAEEPLLPPEPEPEPEPESEEAEPAEEPAVAEEEEEPVLAEERPRRRWFGRRTREEEEAELEPEPEPEPEPEETEEPEPVVAAAAAEDDAFPEEPPRRRWWSLRRRHEEEEPLEAEPVQPRHVRVLPHEEGAQAGRPLDPWEAEDELPPAALEDGRAEDEEREPAERRPT